MQSCDYDLHAITVAIKYKNPPNSITINIAKYPSSPMSMVSIVYNVYKITTAHAIMVRIINDIKRVHDWFDVNLYTDSLNV